MQSFTSLRVGKEFTMHNSSADGPAGTPETSSALFTHGSRMSAVRASGKEV